MGKCAINYVKRKTTLTLSTFMSSIMLKVAILYDTLSENKNYQDYA